MSIDNPGKTKYSIKHAVIKIVGIYILLGSLWIYLSDTLLLWFVQDPATITLISVFKGIFFIVFTSAVLSSLIARYMKQLRKADEALHESEERFRDLVSLLPETVFESDEKGTFTFVNQSAFERFGFTLEDVKNGLGVMDVMIPEDHSRIVLNLQKIIHGEQTGLNEYTARKKDGTTFPVLIHSTCIYHDAKCVGLRGFLIDITEKKKLEQHLIRAQKMEALGLLAGGVAHDLNNVLSGLVSYPELVLMQLPEESPLRKHVQIIMKSGERAAAIVEDLLTLARRGVAVSKALNLNDMIRRYLVSPEHLKLKEINPQIRYETHLENDLLNTMGSPVHLEKTIMNLVSNAAEAMPDGGTVVISSANQYIDKPVQGYDEVSEGDYVTLSVSDMGKGIQPEDRSRIFEPFYTKKSMGRSGTGLGLSVVWGTVKDHNGYIDVRTSPESGTTFTLYFPVTREGLTKARSPAPIEEYMGKGETILVVDDVPEQRELATAMLTRLGYKVICGASGEEAVDYMKAHKVDLVLLDMIMEPGIDGLETYKRIQAIHHRQKAVIVSGFSETSRVQETQELGAGTYIKKPYLLEKIGLAIRNELSRLSAE
jgi:PAS domain S-box-containing protein